MKNSLSPLLTSFPFLFINDITLADCCFDVVISNSIYYVYSPFWCSHWFKVVASWWLQITIDRVASWALDFLSCDWLCSGTYTITFFIGLCRIGPVMRSFWRVHEPLMLVELVLCLNMRIKLKWSSEFDISVIKLTWFYGTMKCLTNPRYYSIVIWIISSSEMVLLKYFFF